MRCPYYHIEPKDGNKYCTCSLFNGTEVQWDTDCKKCISDKESRLHAWSAMSHHIMDNMFSLIPEEWRPMEHCKYQGEILEGVFEVTHCCNGKTKQIPKQECLRDYKAVTQKECLECLAKQRQESLSAVSA